MTPAQWDAAKEIFDQAISLPPHARLDYARNTCGHEPDVLNEVEQLLEAYAVAPSNFLRPIWHEDSVVPSLAQGDIISARYKIVRRIGAGGMGQVYEARDLTLGVTVALKTLRSDIAADPEMLFRFHQEVRIAHSVTHPNVCRTFHLDRETSHVNSGGPPTDITFITMEFLEGETLQQLLKREGRLAPDRALAVARQMAAALGAAHSIGVIHRDIKPGNVMICPALPYGLQSPRVVITDFGLAKSARPTGVDLSSISHPGAAIGTLSYMSPEQLQGLAVTSATDIYAFGLVLFEAVTGRKAFPDSSTFPAAFERVTRQAPSPCELVAGLPAVWDGAIKGCLANEPTKRFANANEVIAALEGEKPALSIAESPFKTRLSVASPLQGHWSRYKIWAAIFLSLIFCVALLWRPLRLSKLRSDGRVAPGTLVYLAPIRNETGDAQLDNVTELVRAGLSQSTQINLLDPASAAEILVQMTKPHDTAITDSIAREIAMRANASRTIFFNLSRFGGRYKMVVEIQRPDLTTPARVRERWSKVFEWTQPSQPQPTAPSDLLAAIRNATDWVRVVVGESSGDVTSLNASPESVTTDNWDALTAFRQAESFDAEHRKWEAIVALRKATALDPHFSLAYARLGDILFNVNRDAEGLDAYRRALDASADRALSRRELDRVQGMYAIDCLDYMTAITAFKDYTAFYPNDYVGWAYPTSALRALGRDEEAVGNLRRAVALAPSLPFPMIELANELAIIGQPDEAQSWIQTLRRKGYEMAAKELAVRLRFLSLDFVGAIQEARELETSNDLPRRLRTYRTHLRLAAELDDYTLATQVANQGVKDSLALGEQATQAAILADRASLECQEGDIRPCIADIDKALSLDEGINTVREVEDTLGSAAASAGKSDQNLIRLELARVANDIDHRDFGYIQRLLHTRAHGELLLAGGDVESALKEMRRAASLDAPTASHEYLGRTLLIAARASKSADRIRHLRQEALEAFAVIARQPRAALLRPWDKPPGTLAAQTTAYLQTARALGEPVLDIPKDFSLYEHLRPHALHSQ